MDSPSSEILRVLQQTRQSRFPVYGEHRDDIIGILHTRDLLNFDLGQLEADRKRFLRLLRKPYFVPESKPALELFDSFRETKRSFALTVDEFGGITGLVTMEEVVEDEYDRQEEEDKLIQRLREKEYIVSARIETDELCNRLKNDLPKGRYATLAGLILEKTHAVPSRGTTIRENCISLIVHRSTARAAMEVRICW